MSGAWARACDDYGDMEQYSDQLPELAVSWLASALRAKDEYQLIDSVERAGACIRAWRKSLSDQGQRIADIDISDDRLLWAALQDVCSAEAKTGRADGEVAKHLRFAEAFLRSWWKRQQEAAS